MAPLPRRRFSQPQLRAGREPQRFLERCKGPDQGIGGGRKGAVMRVIGIDPGTATTGFGLVERTGGRVAGVSYGVIRTEAGTAAAARLAKIHRQLGELIQRHAPEAAAVEEIFFNHNVRSALSVGQARGVCLLAAARADLAVYDYTPPQVKMAVAGYGRARKGQVQRMVQSLLGLEELPRPDDAADALAVAICCLHSRRTAAARQSGQ